MFLFNIFSRNQVFAYFLALKIFLLYKNMLKWLLDKVELHIFHIFQVVLHKSLNPRQIKTLTKVLKVESFKVFMSL